MSPDEGQEELEEVQAEIKKKDEEVNIVFLLKHWQIIIKVKVTYGIHEISALLDMSSRDGSQTLMIFSAALTVRFILFLDVLCPQALAG